MKDESRRHSASVYQSVERDRSVQLVMSLAGLKRPLEDDLVESRVLAFSNFPRL